MLYLGCALCHSTVDNAFAPGIGHRLDAWPNRDLNVGAIVALSPAVPSPLKAILKTWGPGKYDPRINIDGKNTPLVIPPAFGMRHVARETYTADGVVSYWNDYVAVTQMHGHGSFSDPRIGVNINNPPERRRSAVSGIRRSCAARISMMEAPRRSSRWSIIALRCSSSVCPRSRRPTWWRTSRHCDAVSEPPSSNVVRQPVGLFAAAQ